MAKKAKPRRRPASYMMVIRVAVPADDVRRGMKAHSVHGLLPGGRSIPHSLEILSAYYDRPGQPNARQ